MIQKIQVTTHTTLSGVSKSLDCHHKEEGREKEEGWETIIKSSNAEEGATQLKHLSLKTRALDKKNVQNEEQPQIFIMHNSRLGKIGCLRIWKK